MRTKFQSPGGWLECVQGFYLPLTACATKSEGFSGTELFFLVDSQLRFCPQTVVSWGQALYLALRTLALKIKGQSNVTTWDSSILYGRDPGCWYQKCLYNHLMLLVQIRNKAMEISKFRSCIAGDFLSWICHHLSSFPATEAIQDQDLARFLAFTILARIKKVSGMDNQYYTCLHVWWLPRWKDHDRWQTWILGVGFPMFVWKSREQQCGPQVMKTACSKTSIMTNADKFCK